jgi:uncharacterized delta-60 repeat protein
MRNGHGRGRIAAIAVVVVAMAAVVAPAAASGRWSRAGQLDTGTFNAPTGFATTPVGSDSSIGGLVRQPFGKVVAAGEAAIETGLTDTVALVRYTYRGAIDRSFGIDGVGTAVVGVSPNVADALQQGPWWSPHSDIVTVGSVLEPGRFFAVRHDRDGHLDRSFGEFGRAFIDVGVTPEANAGAVQRDGKILIVGGSGNPFADPPTAAAAVARLDRDGTVDTSFGGGDGFVTLQVLETSIAFGVTVQRDGRIIVVGQAVEPPAEGGTALFIARYMPDGTLDPSFGTGTGYRTLQVGSQAAGFDVEVLHDGKIVVSGTGNANDVEGWLFARFESDGALDMGFGGGQGWTVVSPVRPTDDVGTAFAMEVQYDGKIVAGGSFGPNPAVSQFYVARLNRDGSPDLGFGIDGFTRTEVASYAVPTELVLTPFGKIVLGGTANVEGIFQFAVARYLGR